MIMDHISSHTRVNHKVSYGLGRTLAQLTGTLAILGTLSGCNAPQPGTGAILGTSIGTTAGVLTGAAMKNSSLGSKLAVSLASSMAGFIIGSAIDSYVAKQRQAKALEAASLSKAVTWKSTQDQSYVNYTPGPVNCNQSGCRSRPIHCKGIDPQGQPIDMVIYAHQNNSGQWVLSQ
jgi:hypothetical protein